VTSKPRTSSPYSGSFLPPRAARAGSFAVLAAILTTGCATSASSPFVVALPNGYQIVRGKTAAPLIVKKSGGVVIPAPVSRYAVVRDVVVGAGDQTYFVLDTRNGEVSKGLAEAAYNDKLKALNIPASPELSPPVLPQ
jgi:hypothetical protein